MRQKRKSVVASEFEVEFKLDSDVDVYWLIIQGETNKVMENTLTPAMVINFTPTDDNFSGMTIRFAASVVSNLAARAIAPRSKAVMR